MESSTQSLRRSPGILSYSVLLTLSLAGLLATTPVIAGPPDGKLDIVFGKYLCEGDGAGNFSCSSLGLPGRIDEAIIGNLNGDADNDVLFVSGNFGVSSVCLSDGTGGLTCSAPNSDARQFGGDIGDLDGDGDGDLFFTDNGSQVRVCLNDGSGLFGDGTCSTFSSPTSFATELGDMDGDGDLDAVSANVICLGDGAGAFACSSFSGQAYTVGLGDLDADGDLDAVVGGGSGSICFNDGAANLSCATDPALAGARTGAIGDVDGDTHADVVWVGAGALLGLTVCLGDGSGTIGGFTCTNDASDPFSNEGGLELGDLDGDGDLDAAAFVRSGNNRVCFNDGTGSFVCSTVNAPGGAGSPGAVDLGDVTGPDQPGLSIDSAIPAAELETVDVDVDFTANAWSIAATTFSIDYDESCLSFDDTDGDADNIPDDLAFNLPTGFAVTAFHDLGDTDGEIDVSVADLAPPIATLADDAILTITFTSTCSPAVSTTIVAPVVFSSDPAATFGDDLAVDVAGTTVDGSVEIWPGPRGDCNSTGALSAADLIADALEIFDGDGSFWADVVGSTYVGSPVGCDANDDMAVDAGDISCTILLIFGGSCGGGRGMLDAGGAFDPRTSPVLGLERGTLGKDGKLWIPVVFSAGSHGISSTAFSLNLMRGLRFDPFDGDGDGLPDSVRFPRGRPDLVDVRYDARDRRGEIDLTIGTFDGVLADGVLLEIAVESRRHLAVNRLRKAVRFSKAPAASFGDLYGRAVPGRAVVVHRGK